MKTLYLLRHAKSSWAAPDQTDHERPLNERGRKAATAMGRYLRSLPSHPTMVLASTARRVSETLELLLLEMPEGITVIRDRNLYLAPAKRLLSRLHSTYEKSSTILIVGHNPGIHEFALQLSDELDDEAAPDALKRLKNSYPTAALTMIRFPDAKFWREVGYGQGRLVSFTRPRDLTG